MKYCRKRLGAIVSLMLFAAVVVCGDLRTENREGLARDLTTLALRAQDFYRRNIWEGGGGNSFVYLTADPTGMSILTTKPVTPNGFLTISNAGTATSVVLRGCGTQIGNDGAPIEIEVVVFADSTAIVFHN